MSIEAMKQALEALELVIGDIEWQEFSPTRKFCQKTITALRTAIRQAEKQEPFVWMEDDKGNKYPMPDENKGTLLKRAEEAFESAKKREWVGLTDEEAGTCWSTSAVQTWKNIEAKLKEKNT